MKKIIFLLLALSLLFCSCVKEEHSVLLNDDGTLSVDGAIHYPIENSQYFTSSVTAEKVGAVFGSNVLELDSGVYLANGTYYTDRKGYSRLFEECEEYFYAPVRELNDSRLDPIYIGEAKRLTDKNAEDFSFYIFYGLSPDELGCTDPVYIGEIIGTLPEFNKLFASYPVYLYGSGEISVEIDGEEYMMEEKWAKAIGIM